MDVDVLVARFESASHRQSACDVEYDEVVGMGDEQHHRRLNKFHRYRGGIEGSAWVSAEAAGLRLLLVASAATQQSYDCRY